VIRSIGDRIRSPILLITEQRYKLKLIFLKIDLIYIDPRVDPSAKDSIALFWASRNGYKDIVQLLLQDERVDPSARNNMAIQMAREREYHEIVDLLQDTRVQKIEKAKNTNQEESNEYK
jgi:hypothetical protein